MRRGNFYNGTIAASTTLDLSTGVNEKITRITIEGTAANFYANLTKKGSTAGAALLFNSAGGYDSLLTTTYTKQVSDIADLQISNGHGSNSLSYHIWTEEFIS